MFHAAAFASLSASNPQAGQECSRTHNGLSVETPHDAHSLVVPLGSTARSVPSRIALVFEQREERPPCRRRRVSTVRRRFHHPFHVQVFDRHKVVLPSVVGGELVQEVAALPSEISVTLCDLTPLLLVVVRPVLFAREFPLLAFQAFTILGLVKWTDCRAFGIVGIRENPYVDTDALLGFSQVPQEVRGPFGRRTWRTTRPSIPS